MDILDFFFSTIYLILSVENYYQLSRDKTIKFFLCTFPNSKKKTTTFEQNNFHKNAFVIRIQNEENRQIVCWKVWALLVWTNHFDYFLVLSRILLCVHWILPDLFLKIKWVGRIFFYSTPAGVLTMQDPILIPSKTLKI